MTHAQVELALHDRPVTDFNRGKKNKDGFTKPSRDAVERANQKFRENAEKSGGEKGGTIDLSKFKIPNKQ